MYLDWLAHSFLRPMGLGLGSDLRGIGLDRDGLGDDLSGVSLNRNSLGVGLNIGLLDLVNATIFLVTTWESVGSSQKGRKGSVGELHFDGEDVLNECGCYCKLK